MRFLWVFGVLMFIACFIFFVMNFMGGFSGITLVVTLFGMLNAGIAIGVAELLNRSSGLSKE
ncbi:hypothetical protein [Planococcus sp. CAU13]|uniref:hypothetical protein n=1 Tax=Planococcus sp. CAU13 TaxID=1541197 RepID=UPI00052FE66C|nr:hypothetical protein [Planococcus sp. CAU13]